MESRERRPVAEYLEKVWGDLEKNVEEGVKKAMAKVKTPNREEISELVARIEAVERRIAALADKRK